jgi:hypothetical protein
MEKEDIAELFIIRKKFRDEHISKDVLKNTHFNFATNFEHSFDMICSHDCDDNMLNKLLNAHMLVRNGSMTQHDASVAVGQVLVDTYVKPNIDPPNQSS